MQMGAHDLEAARLEKRTCLLRAQTVDIAEKHRAGAAAYDIRIIQVESAVDEKDRVEARRIRGPQECTDISPVSYTHLDVYKRQGLYIS